MIQILINNPILLLSIVSAIGYVLGRIKIAGVSLGVSAVLFVGLAFGALDPNLKLPEIVYLLGLVIFVYTIGLSSGPGFFVSLQRKGLRDNLLVLGVLLVAALLAGAARLVIGVSAPVAAGIFAGSLTNTPALAGAIEQLKRRASGALSDEVLAEPVVGYSVTYPMGVLGMILAIYVLQRVWKVDYAAEARSFPELSPGSERLINRTVRITQPGVAGRTIGELVRANRWNVVFSRIQHDGHMSLATTDVPLHLNDLVSVIGAPEEIERVVTALGEVVPEGLDLDRHTLDFRRVFVSNPEVVGRRLRDLDLPRTHGAIITRLRRGDVDILPHGDTVLELGDRVRIVTRRDNLDEVSRYFGDSYRSLSEVDVVSLGLGLTLGLLVGMIPIPLPGGGAFTLGFAGGPLIVALVLGWLERSGPIIWSLPYSANLTLRQMGLIMFLAGVGTRSGYSFVSTLVQGGGFAIFLIGAGITAFAALSLLFVGHKLLKIPMGLCIGLLAGMQTQPAVLAFASEQTRNDMPNIGYATVYPLATIAKIILAQVLIGL